MYSPYAAASLLGAIQNLYPQARVTSGYRGPNNPLTLRNPSSFHARGTPDDPRAVDVAPIPGVTFDQYKAAVGAKVPIAQAFDEATHPFPWTTGPNWHLATGQAPKMAALPKKPRTLADIAAPSMGLMPVQLGQQTHPPAAAPFYPPTQQPMTLADLSANDYPQGGIPQKKHSPFTAGNVLGVLGDALMAYGGLQPQFGPGLRKQQEDDKQMAFDREKLNAELEIQRQKALEPPAEVQTASYWDHLRRTDPAQFVQMMTTMDAYSPKTSIGPQGEQIVPRVQTKVINDRVFHNIGGQWVEEVQ